MSVRAFYFCHNRLRESGGAVKACSMLLAPCSSSTRFQRAEVFNRLGIVGVVVDDQQLVVWISRLREDALDARLENIEPVAGRDDDRDERRGIRDRIVYPPIRAFRRCELCVDARS